MNYREEAKGEISSGFALWMGLIFADIGEKRELPIPGASQPGPAGLQISSAEDQTVLPPPQRRRRPVTHTVKNINYEPRKRPIQLNPPLEEEKHFEIKHAPIEVFISVEQ